MIKIVPLCLVMLLCILILNDCASISEGERRREGITGDQLIVTIHEFFLFEENITRDEIALQVKGKVDQRASLVIASYININLPRNKVSDETDGLMNRLIDKTVSEGKFKWYDCDENHYCTASCEYRMTEIQSSLGDIISR